MYTYVKKHYSLYESGERERERQGEREKGYTVQIYLDISIITRVLIHGVCYITNNKKRQIENTAN